MSKSLNYFKIDYCFQEGQFFNFLQNYWLIDIEKMSKIDLQRNFEILIIHFQTKRVLTFPTLQLPCY